MRKCSLCRCASAHRFFPLTKSGVLKHHPTRVPGLQHDEPQFESENINHAWRARLTKLQSLREISTISFVIGTISLAFAGAGVVAGLHEARVIKTDAAMRSAAYEDEFEDRAAGNECFTAVTAGCVVSAIFLLLGARSLSRGKSSGLA